MSSVQGHDLFTQKWKYWWINYVYNVHWKHWMGVTFSDLIWSFGNGLVSHWVKGFVFSIDIPFHVIGTLTQTSVVKIIVINCRWRNLVGILLSNKKIWEFLIYDFSPSSKKCYRKIELNFSQCEPLALTTIVEIT